MARHTKGVMGSFFGKVGTVIGGEWRGVKYMRSLPELKKNRKLSEKQLYQLAKFKLAAEFLKNISDLVGSTYQPVVGQTGKNGALGHTIRHAVEGDDIATLFINYSNVMVASGGLKKASSPAASSVNPGVLDFTWEHSAAGAARAEDQAILVAYCVELGDVWYTLEGPARSMKQGQLEVPFFSGKRVHTWVSFVSPKNGQIADSVYTGEVLIA